MALRITIDMFSGRPNPVVMLDDREAADLLKRLQPAEKLRAREATPPPESILGYRGLIVEQTGKVISRELPAIFRVIDGRLFGPKLAHRATDPFVEDFVCGTTGPIRRLSLGRNFLDLLRKDIEHHRHSIWKWPPIRWPVRPACLCAPLYEPAWWNDATAGGARQFNNNCYNYATNYRTDTFAQPGLGSGLMYPFPIACAGVRTASIRDDLIDASGANNRCPKEGHLVALVVGPG